MKRIHYSVLFFPSFFLFHSLDAQEFTVPSAWEAVAEAQDGEIISISIQDGWIAWMEKRIDPATAMNRAPSAFVGLYRKQLGTDATEILIEPRESGTGGDQFILGTDGIVSSNYRGASRQVLYPQKPRPPVFLCPLEPRRRNPVGMGNTETFMAMGQGEHTPVRIFTEGLICLYANRNQTGRGVSIIPWDGTGPDPNQAEILSQPDADRFYDGDWNGQYILYSMDHTMRLYNKRTGKHDFTFQTKDRFEYFTHVCLDRHFVYFYLSAYNSVGFGEIFRFSIQEKTLERMPLPHSFWGLIDLTAEQVLYICTAGSHQHELLSSNLSTGEICRYDFSYAAASLSGGFGGFTENHMLSLGYNLSGDAENGTVLICHKNKLYLIPKTSDPAETWPSFGWTSAIREETRDRLVIRDQPGQEIPWCKKDTFMAAAIQAVSEMANPQKNRDHLEDLIRRAAHHGAKVVVLPETAITGYMSWDLKTTWQIEGSQTTAGLQGLDPKAYAEPVPGDSTKHFVGLANELEIYLTVPFLEIDPATGRYYNSVVLMRPEGRYEKTYRKLNPWPFAERSWAAKGDLGLVAADTPYGRMVPLICFDINFEPPNLKAMNVDHLLYSIAWVDDKNSRWFSENLPAIAKRNNLNIIGANWTIPPGSQPDWHGYGKSVIIDRNGEILAKADRDIGEKIIYAELPIEK